MFWDSLHISLAESLLLHFLFDTGCHIAQASPKLTNVSKDDLEFLIIQLRLLSAGIAAKDGAAWLMQGWERKLGIHSTNWVVAQAPFNAIFYPCIMSYLIPPLDYEVLKLLFNSWLLLSRHSNFYRRGRGRTHGITKGDWLMSYCSLVICLLLEGSIHSPQKNPAHRHLQEPVHCHQQTNILCRQAHRG